MAQQIDVPGLGVVEFPDGMSDDQIAAAIKRSNMQMKPTTIGAGNFKTALAETLKEAPLSTKMIAGFGVGASDLIERAKQLFGKEDRTQIEANKMIRDDNPMSAVAGDVAMTGIPLSKLMPVFSGAPTALGKAAQYAGNVGVGAATGAALSQLRPDANMQTAEEGAIGGAIGAGVIAPLVSFGAKSAGRLWDVMTGKHADVAAGRIFRDAAGADLPKIKAAMAGSADDITAAQAAYGIDRDTWFALGELAKRNDKESFYRVLADAQNQAQRQAVSGVAGGATQAEALASRSNAKDSVTAMFKPNMERELAAANEGRKIVEARAAAKAFDEAAASKVADFRRFENAGASADDFSQAGRNAFDGQKNIRGQQLGRVAESASQKAALESQILGEGRRFSTAIADAIEKRGIKPLDVEPIIANIRAKMGNSSAAGNDDYAKVLNKVVSDMQEWAARGGGVIDSHALYAIRKNSVNNAITNLTGKADPKAAAKFEAEVLSDIRPMIDDAIEQAGGKGWRDTLKIFESGMREVNQQKMGGKLLELFDKSKKNFVEMVKGNNTKDVQKVFGYGKDSGDIAAQMGEKINPLRRVADEIERDRLIGERATGASNALADILEKDTMKFRLPSMLRREATIANKGLDIVEGQLNAKTKEKIVLGMRSGKSALEVINTLPAYERENALRLLIQSTPQASVLMGAEVAR